MLNRIFTLIALTFLVHSTSYADEITDAITDGAKQYSTGNYSEAIGQLEYAATLIRQMKAESAKALLPQPFDGWTSRDEDESGTGNGVLGMVSVSRTYTKEDKELKVSLVTDSPMLQGMMGFFNNPMVVSMGGGKLFKVGDQKVMLQGDGGQSNHLTATTVVNNKVLVTVEGTATEADIKAYLQALDFVKIAKTL